MASNYKTIKGNDLARAVVEAMREYTEEVGAAIRQEVDATANDIKQAVVAGAPSKTGKYKGGWKVTKKDSQSATSRVVHNAKTPGLVHLLEHGHAKRGGGRVPGQPHVAPAAEPRLKQMEENIKRILEKGG